MSDLTAVLLVVVVGPVTGLIGMILLGRPHDVFRLTALYGRFVFRLVGLYRGAHGPGQTPGYGHLDLLSRVIDRGCENPRSLAFAVLSLRLSGIFWVVLSIIATVAGVTGFVSD